MKTTMFDSNAFGVGELITQRKLFNVPMHQRSYSWDGEAVEQFLTDISTAFSNNSSDYFIGLMVLQGPSNGIWQILDGQQRLTTVTMIYSAIRNWLKERGFDEDAEQIETEYLGVRQLGGAFSARLRLNSINNETFEKHIIKTSPSVDLDKAKVLNGKEASNNLLLEAAILCRKWIERVAEDSAHESSAQARKLFQLSSFLEIGLKVVTVDVANDADPYILFEALNNRGADLTELDLVKNYIFSTKNADMDHLDGLWSHLIDLIENTDADDFLKYFWTARFGIIQKSDLFKKIRTAYQGDNAGTLLLWELIDAADIAEAMQEMEHPMWMTYSADTRNKIFGVRIIGSKQARPLLYSALKKLDEVSLNLFVDDLITCLIRFQVIGHGRTGILEKVIGRLSPIIWEGTAFSNSGYQSILREIYTTDEQFLSDFNAHHEKKISRAHYLIKEIELGQTCDTQLIIHSKAIYLAPLENNSEDPFKKLGCYFLLEDNLVDRYSAILREFSIEESIPHLFNLFSESKISTTSMVNTFSSWRIEDAEKRTKHLAQSAVSIWEI